MSLDFCSNCGRWIGSLEGVIRQDKDGNAEIICDECIANEQGASKLTVDMSIAKLVSAGIID